LNQYGRIIQFVKLDGKDFFYCYSIANNKYIHMFKYSSKLKITFNVCKLDKYFIAISNINFSYVSCPVKCLVAPCIKVEIPEEDFDIITEIFDFEHD
jgi:hypothetical protein